MRRWVVTIGPEGDIRGVGDVTDTLGLPERPHPLGWAAVEVVPAEVTDEMEVRALRVWGAGGSMREALEAALNGDGS